MIRKLVNTIIMEGGWAFDTVIEALIAKGYSLDIETDYTYFQSNSVVKQTIKVYQVTSNP